MSPRWVSPLRYPGGKVRMTPWLLDVFDRVVMPMDVEVWIEPFGGGAGAALMALESGIPEAWIVEANPALAAFWTAVTSDEGQLAARVETTIPTLGMFQEARDAVGAALAGETLDPAEVAFSGFLVNRCSRSGMILPNVGPIGGKAQNGRYTLASRFNGPRLAERLRYVAAFGERFRVIDGDGIDYIEQLPDSGIEDEVFLFVDPPYLGVGDRLYAQGMDRAEHARLAAALRVATAPWVLTYDAHPDVLDLYPDADVIEFDIPHTANRGQVGTEYLITPPGLARFALPGNPLGKGD